MKRPAIRAVAVLRAAFRQHVEDLAAQLRPRLVAGAFTVPDDSDDIGPWDALEKLCGEARTPWGDDPALTFALAPPRARAAALRGYDPDDLAGLAAMVVAWEVRQLAIDRWDIPRDDCWVRTEDEQRATQPPATA